MVGPWILASFLAVAEADQAAGFQLLVQPNQHASRSEVNRVHEALGCRVLSTLPGADGVQVVSAGSGLEAVAALRAYRDCPLVEFAEPDYVVTAACAVLPDDPLFGSGDLWAFDNSGADEGLADADIDAPAGWSVRTDAEDVVVALIDSGVRSTHEDLAANLWTAPDTGSHGFDAIGGSDDPVDESGHGTAMAGIIGAVGNNGRGAVGVAWRVRIMACKFLDASNQGSISDAIRCMDFARENGARIINASWGLNQHSQALFEAVDRARQDGVIVVAAAGNDGADTDFAPFYPAGFDLDNVVSVAASTRADQRLFVSNFGVTSVDLAAPGEMIHSTDAESDRSYSVGPDSTSSAAAFVSGALALVRAEYPDDDYRQCIRRILDGVDVIPALAGVCRTGGRLNLNRALRASSRLRMERRGNVDNPKLVIVVCGRPDQLYQLESSRDLRGWIQLDTGQADADGRVEFEVAPSDDGNLFFRCIDL